ncbi:hypothetical protein PHSY_006197 [Pseudozyma hubeiensis SY62]|uniref:Uncharacterized protein n=1 Tax=Pseudozyma hubeiensis (strain SY62) TaxID=1305764 RepID=R9PB21_PSEHS|nr:hypothetical protein PHSY_006197 [Pseudozyma hubeiensis SY62]GAC98603.1 hypothetical protein PHSY_006197 [Pseudozyma hubeiensis SY62]
MDDVTQGREARSGSTDSVRMGYLRSWTEENRQSRKCIATLLGCVIRNRTNRRSLISLLSASSRRQRRRDTEANRV